MNNIYVDGDLPDNCKTCQYKSIARCVLLDENVFNYIVYETCPKECPVKPLSDRLAEERKKVVQEIRSKSYSLKNTPMYNEYGGIIGTFNKLDYGKLEKILDQIERN